eukprot:3941036-Rhodomonas_salina.2
MSPTVTRRRRQRESHRAFKSGPKAPRHTLAPTIWATPDSPEGTGSADNTAKPLHCSRNPSLSVATQSTA